MTTPDAVAAPLSDALASLLRSFREEAANLTPEQADRIQTINDLRGPCQLTVFAFDVPAWTVFILTHSQTAPDGQIRIHENVKPWTAFDVLETELAEALWDDPQRDGDRFFVRSPEPEARLRSLIEQAFLTINHNARVFAAMDPATNHGNYLSQSLLGRNAAMWSHHGDPNLIDWDGFLQGAFEEARRPPPVQAVPPPAPPTAAVAAPAVQNTHPGRGAYHYPAMRVGVLPAPRLLSLLVARDAIPGVLVLSDHLGPHELLVTHNGFLGLMTSDTADALRWLNFAMAGFRRHGYASRPIQEADIGSFHRPDSRLMSWGGSWPSRGPGRDAWEYGWNTPWLSDDQLRACLRTAEDLAAKPYAARIQWVLEAEAHLTDHQFAQSLIFSWAIIEDVLAQRWDAFIAAKNITGNRRKELRSTREWPLQSRLDALELAGALPRPIYERLVATKRVRNRAMHGTEFPNQDEAKAALDIAEDILLGDEPRIRAPLVATPLDLHFL